MEMQAFIKRSRSNKEKIIPMSEHDKRELQQMKLLKGNVSVASSGSACALVPAGVGGLCSSKTLKSLYVLM